MLNPKNFLSSGRATALFDSFTLQPKLGDQEAANTGHDALPSPVTADINVAVICVTAESMAAPGKFPVKLIKHEVA